MAKLENTVYKRKKKDEKKTGTGVDDVYVTRWLHYKQIEFLEDYVTPKTTQNTQNDIIHTDNIIE